MQFTVVKLIDYLIILMLILIIGCLLLLDSMYKQYLEVLKYDIKMHFVFLLPLEVIIYCIFSPVPFNPLNILM